MLVPRVVVTVLLLAVTYPIVPVSAAGAVGDPCCDEDWACTGHVVTCNTGLACCYSRPTWEEGEGGYCYDPQVSTCASCPVYNPNHPQTRVCPTSSPTCCQGACINSTKQCCHHDLSYDSWVCPVGTTCCGFNNYYPTCCTSGQICVNDVCVSTPTCPDGTLECGSSCYKSTEHVCADASRALLCPLTEPSLCGRACYNQAQYTCIIGVLAQGGTTTSAPTTPAPTQAPTAAPGCLLPGDQRCGTTCYSPVTHVCANAGTNQLCPVAFPSLCGSNACYSSSQYSCSNGQLVPLASNGATQSPAVPGCVMPGDQKCGDRCYSPVTHVCANAGTSFLCPVAYPSLCGSNACYSSSQYNCVNGQLIPK